MTSTTGGVSSSTTMIQKRLLDFVKFYTRYEKQPGFASIVSGLTYETVQSLVDRNDNKLLSYNNDNHVMRIRMKPFILQKSITNSTSLTSSSEKSSTLSSTVQSSTSTSTSNTTIKKNNYTNNDNTIEHQIPVLTKYMATMDDITTWGLVLADSNYGRPGLSLNLSCFPGPALDRYLTSVSTSSNSPTIELVSQVTKIGKNMGFVQYQVLLVDDDDDDETDDNITKAVITPSTEQQQQQSPTSSPSSSVICFGTQTKFLPMGYLSDFIFSKYGWNIMNLYSEYLLSPKKYSNNNNNNNVVPPYDVATILQTFNYNPQTYTATFQACNYHSSLGAPIHGGCQGMLMEIIGTKVARHVLVRDNDNNIHSYDDVRMESIYVDYMSSPPKDVQLQVDQIIPDTTCSTLSLRVKLVGNKDGKIKSIGHLKFRLYNNTNNDNTVSLYSEQQLAKV